MRSFFSPTLLKRAVIGVSVSTLMLASFTTTASALQTAQVTRINTFGLWDGSTVVHPFGCPNTSAYGETLTVPAGNTNLDRFTVTWQDLSTGSFRVRGEVYAWDPSTFHATGSAIAETSPRTVHSGTSGFFEETFAFKEAVVSAGQQYVVFASLVRKPSTCHRNSYSVGWGAIASDSPYPDGTFVYQNSGPFGRPARWTTRPWNSFEWDLAFKACFS